MSKYILLISGKQGSGKSSLIDSIEKLYSPTGHFLRTRFAKVLYEMHDAVRDIARSRGIPVPDKMGKFLQVTGTEVFRDEYGENVWVDCYKKEVKDFAEKHDNKVIAVSDDCRFLNEVESYDNEPDYKKIKIRLEASREVRKARCHGWRDNEGHRSETELDDYDKWDLVINTEENSAEQTLEIALQDIKRLMKGEQNV